MNKDYQIDSARNIVFTAYSGNTTTEDVIATINRVLADPEYRPGINAVCDFTEATAVWSLADVDRFRVFVSKIKELTPRSRWAVIFPKGKDTTSARIFVALHNAFSTNLEVQLFRDRHSALQWLQESPASSASAKTSEEN